ncbi:MAG: STAS domain-containing protein [Magnetococcales bacterium]|nr:STAS domain-containing protein [Magnetococcales bacterium]
MKVSILQIKNQLLTSIQTDLTDDDLSQFREDLLDKIAKVEPEGVVIDITSLDTVDSYMARILSETAHMVKMMGAHAVVCGMQPYVALTLVEMGRELVNVDTALNLDHGLEKLEALRESNALIDDDDDYDDEMDGST